MREFVSEYRNLVVDSGILFYDLRVKFLKDRFDALKACKKNFMFNEKEQSEYADLVIQFNNANAVNTVGDVTFNDTKQSLLDEFH